VRAPSPFLPFAGAFSLRPRVGKNRPFKERGHPAHKAHSRWAGRPPSLSLEPRTPPSKFFQNSATLRFPLSALRVSVRVLLPAMRRCARDIFMRCLARSRSSRPSGCLRQGWFAFLPECLTLRAAYAAYRTTALLLGSRPAPAGTCSAIRSDPGFPFAGIRVIRGPFWASAFPFARQRTAMATTDFLRGSVPP
jgi:hypothetical protein